jgi:hypothetical protein
MQFGWLETKEDEEENLIYSGQIFFFHFSQLIEEFFVLFF